VSTSSVIGSLSSSGTSSSGNGIDVGATVDQLIYTEQAPERLLQSQQSMLNAQSSALRGLNSSMESLENSVNNLKDLTGAFGSRSVQSSNQVLLTATADSSAVTGRHAISVSQLATVASQYSDTLSSATSTFPPGTLQFRIASGAVQTVTFDDKHNTLTSAAQYINGLKLGVSASVVSDALGSRLTLVSGSSGAAGDLTVTAAPAGLGFHVGVAGQNAKLTVDGVPIQSATNQVTGALAGVTLNITGTTSEVPITLTVAADTDKASAAINSMVSAYNSIIHNINAQFTYNATTGSAGTLAGDSSVRSVQSGLLSAMSFQLSDKTNTYTTLRSLGIKMQDDGTLSVDDAQLSTALQNDPDAVEKFFQGNSSNGFANTLSTKLMSLTDTTDGPLNVDAKGIDDSVKSIQDQIDQFEVRIDMRRQILTDQYTKIDTELRQLPLLQQQITAQLGTLK
jgi:flagellar hook-associated protein 2